MKRNHRSFEIENYEQCNNELLAMFNKQYPNPQDVWRFWLFPDDNDFFEMCPTVVESFAKCGLTVNHVYLISIAKTHEETIHVDHKANPVRVHWPIYNSGSAVTRWYTFDGDLETEAQVKIVDGDGPPYDYYPHERCTMIDELVMTGPTVFRVDIPHSAAVIAGMPQPRMAYSFSFKERARIAEILYGV
jgi:hypothetical protein